MKLHRVEYHYTNDDGEDIVVSAGKDENHAEKWPSWWWSITRDGTERIKSSSYDRLFPDLRSALRSGIATAEGLYG